METSSTGKRNEILGSVAHYLTALVVFLKGISKIDTPGKGWIAILFIAIAVVLFAGTLLHHRLHRILRHFKAYMFTLEAIVMALVGYVYWKEGKQMIQYVCFGASAMFVVALIIYIVNQRRKKI